MLLCSCSTATKSSNSELSKSEFYTGEIILEEVFNQKPHRYLVYFYSTHCLHCLNLKKTISDFILKQYYSIFMVEISDGYVAKIDDIELSIGSTDYNYVYAGATPQLSLIEDKQIQQSVIGEEDVRIMLYTFIN